MRILIVCFFCFCLYLPQLIKQPFKMTQVKMENRAEWNVGTPSEEVKRVLGQNFHYLDHGNQVTVFVSDDGQYVLKLFRHNRPRFVLVHKMKNWISWLQNKKIKNDFSTKMEKTFSAAHLAYTEAAEFTQVLFCHLNLTENLLPKIKLKGHRSFSVALDEIRFVLQRKVTPFAEAFMAQKNNPAALQKMIGSLIELIEKRSLQGIRNADPNLAPNFGFRGTEAVEIDFGNYRKMAPHPGDREKYLRRLREWFDKHMEQKIDFT